MALVAMRIEFLLGQDIAAALQVGWQSVSVLDGEEAADAPRIERRPLPGWRRVRSGQRVSERGERFRRSWRNAGVSIAGWRGALRTGASTDDV